MSSIDENTCAEQSQSIPDGWVETTLGDVTKFANSKIEIEKIGLENYISTENLLANKAGVTKATSLPNMAKVNKFEKGDTLFSNIRTYFKKVWYADKIGGSSNDVLLFRPNSEKEINSKFLYYFISSDKFIDFTVKSAKGTKMPRGDKNAMKSLSFLIPKNIEEQKAIADILTAFDNKIQNLQAQNKTLEQTTQTIFKEWFFTNNESSNMVNLGELIEIKGGYSYKGSELGMGDSYLLGMGCVSNNHRFLHKGARLYSNNVPDSFLVKPGEIVLATRQQSENLPILGFPAIIPQDFEGKKVIVGTNLYMVNNTSSLNNETLFLLLKSKKYRNHILNNSKGTTVKMITKDSVESFKFNMPNEEVLNNFTSIINPITDKIKNNAQQIQTLKKNRDTLLPKLMSGQVRVNEFNI